MSDSEGNTSKNDKRSLYASKDTSSVEDLSEYTDADESISAPTEFLAEFLSAVMLKDYETALKYCNLILQYEPNNATAKEFHPLIIEKLEILNNNDSDGDDSISEESSSSSCSSCPDSLNSEGSVNMSSSSKSANCSASEEDQQKRAIAGTDSDATTASYSSLEEDEFDRDNNVVGVIGKIFENDLTNGNIDYRQPPEKLSITKHCLNEEFRIKLDITNKGKGVNQTKDCKAEYSPDSDAYSWEVSPVDEQMSPVFPPGLSSDSESPTDPSSQPSMTTINSILGVKQF